MADAVASQTIQDGLKTAVLKFTNISDGTGESAVAKVDVSALGADASGRACTDATIEKIWWQCTGMKVSILFDDRQDSNFFNISMYFEYTRYEAKFYENNIGFSE